MLWDGIEHLCNKVLSETLCGGKTYKVVNNQLKQIWVNKS